MADKFKVAPPAAPQENPYLPTAVNQPLLFEQFLGINTSTTRPGVDDKQAWWMDGWMPIGPRDLRTMPDVGTSLWTTPTGTIPFFDFGNIGYLPYCIAIISNGAIYAIRTDTGAATLIAAAGTITTPTNRVIGLSQWGSQYIIIVAQQPNGYFLWDGTNFYGAGSLGPQVTITNNGTGYTSAPGVAASGGSGSGASFVATVSGGLVTSIAMTNPGHGYSVGDTVTLGFSGGGGSAAAASVTLMPFGVGGSSVETYAGRVWVCNGPVVMYTGPGSVSNFSGAVGGGRFTSSDSFLRAQYTQLKQANGFLYLIGDSSINYISGVQTSGTPPITTFTNQNSNPEVGTPWLGTVDVWGQSIVFANAFGAHVSYGSAVTKISEPLDGVFNTVANFGTFVPSAAKAIIYGKKVWVLLWPIIDPITQIQTNKLFLWNGKIWWSTNQSVVPTYINNQEINSIITAWCTDGTRILPMFQTPSTGFTKTVQTKLWDQPGGYQFTKAASRLWAMFSYTSLSTVSVTISVDNESGSNPTTYTLPPANLPSTTVLGPAAVGQAGTLIGATVTTNAADVTLVSAMIADDIYAYRG